MMMENFANKKQKEEVTGISRSGRVRKKSSKLMDFESPDEIERQYNKKTGQVVRKSDSSDMACKKIPRTVESMLKEEPDYDAYIGGSDSEYTSEYDQHTHTESSIGSESETDFDDHEGGLKKLEFDNKKQPGVKDFRSFKGDKIKRRDRGKLQVRKQSLSKTSPLAYQAGGDSYDSSINNISPPSPKAKDSSFKVNGIKPIDVAAHLKLLGESLTIIGERLKEHEGQIAVSGSLSVLLDSLLCALGPLLCLTQQIPELQHNCCSPEQLLSTLDNVAFIMPGL